MAVPSSSGVTPPRGRSVVTARALNAPGALRDDLYVSINGQRSLVLGWAHREPLPEVGSLGLVQFDQDGNPWVTSWA